MTGNDHIHDAFVAALRQPALSAERVGEEAAVAAMVEAQTRIPAASKGPRSRRGVAIAAVTVASLGLGGLAAAGPGIFSPAADRPDTPATPPSTPATSVVDGSAPDGGVAPISPQTDDDDADTTGRSANCAADVDSGPNCESTSEHDAAPRGGEAEPTDRDAGKSNEAPGRTGDTPGRNGRTPGRSGTTPGQSGQTPNGSGTIPGQSGETPGQSGDTPGQSGETPGQSGDTPGQPGETPSQSGDTPGRPTDTPGETRRQDRTP